MEGTLVKKFDLDEMEKVVLTAPDGKEIKIIPLESVESDDGKLYVAYVYEESLKNDNNVDIYASRLAVQNGNIALVDLETEEEFKLVRSVMDSYKLEYGVR